MFSSLLNALEKSHKLVVAAVEQKQKEAEKRVERLVKDLEKEILELENGHTNPEHLNDKERLKKVITSSVLFAIHILSFCFVLLCLVFEFIMLRVKELLSCCSKTVDS